MADLRDLLDQGDTSPAAALAAAISDLSEDTYCAGWLMDVEFDAWSWVLRAPSEPIPFGLGAVMPDDVAALKRLSDQAGGWVRWQGDGAEAGVVFVPMDAWRALYAEHVAREHATDYKPNVTP